MQKHLSILLTLTALAVATTGFAGNSSSSDSQGGNGQTDTLKITSEGTLTPAKMPTPHPQDRGQASKAAAAAAAAGAAQSNVNCMRMMNQALGESGNTKLMMMMLANQQCQQGTQLEMSAMQNDKSSKDLSAADIPTPAKFTAGKTDLQPGKSNEATISFNDNAPSSSSLADKGAIPVDAPIVPDLGTKTKDPVAAVSAQAKLPTSQLPPIKPGSIQFDESGKNPGAAMAASAGGMMPFGMGNTKQQDSSSSSASTNSTALATADPKITRSARGTADASVSGGGGEESERKGGDDALDALMAQLGGTPPADAEATESAGSQIMGTAENPGGDRANIFEYATTRYSKLLDDKRLGGPKPPPERSVASVQ